MRKDSMHLTHSGRHFKPGFLEGDHPGQEINQEADIEKIRERMGYIAEEGEEDQVLKQLKKIQANISIWRLLTTSKKHHQVLLDALA